LEAAVGVTYTVESNATNYTDSSVLTFPPEATMMTITVDLPAPSAAWSPTVGFTVQLSAPTEYRATLGEAAIAEITLEDPDPQPTVAFEQSEWTVEENLGSVEITVVRSGNMAGALTVEYSVTAGAGASDAHFDAVEQATLTFADQAATASFFVYVYYDITSPTGNRDLLLTLAAADEPYALSRVSTPNAVISIVPVSCSVVGDCRVPGDTEDEDAAVAVHAQMRLVGVTLAHFTDAKQQEFKAAVASQITANQAPGLAPFHQERVVIENATEHTLSVGQAQHRALAAVEALDVSFSLLVEAVGDAGETEAVALVNTLESVDFLPSLTTDLEERNVIAQSASVEWFAQPALVNAEVPYVPTDGGATDSSGASDGNAAGSSTGTDGTSEVGHHV
jgi:hypothetical protein